MSIENLKVLREPLTAQTEITDLLIYKCSGMYSDQYNSKFRSCIDGMYAVAGATAFSVCVPVSFALGNSSKSVCTPCPVGMFGNKTGMYLPSDFCDAGSCKPMSEAVCMQCNIGQYQNMSGQGSCLPCAPGSWACSSRSL
jgi:hypothetical protein